MQSFESPADSIVNEDEFDPPPLVDNGSVAVHPTTLRYRQMMEAKGEPVPHLHNVADDTQQAERSQCSAAATAGRI